MCFCSLSVNIHVLCLHAHMCVSIHVLLSMYSLYVPCVFVVSIHSMLYLQNVCDCVLFTHKHGCDSSLLHLLNRKSHFSDTPPFQSRAACSKGNVGTCMCLFLYCSALMFHNAIKSAICLSRAGDYSVLGWPKTPSTLGRLQ